MKDITETEQQLRAANQQLDANNQQLQASEQQLKANKKILQKSKQTAERYLNIAAEIIISLDKNGKITLLNENGHKILGYKNTELLGKDWFSTCVPKSISKEIREVFSKLMMGEINNAETYDNKV
ncbi:MAG: PAS domain-containing protein, partial [Candidatus Cloacimonadota bacterium]|nr:PAS domain-containing protein [Candidatus Cloacimonadota bacterium]